MIRLESATTRRWLAIAVCALAGALLLWATHDVVGDDPHITFTYSRNLAHGHGLVFNVGDRTLSTTTPLTALLMAIPSALGLNVGLANLVLSAVSATVIGVVLYRNMRPVAGEVAAITTALVAILHPFTVTTASNEILLYVALAVVALHFAVRARALPAATSAALCTLTRPDGVLVLGLVAGIILAHAWSRRRQGESMRKDILGASIAATCVLGPWLIFATLYYGSPVPVTLRAKRAQRQAGLGGGFVDMVQQRFEDLFQSRWYVLGAALTIVGVAVSLCVAWSAMRRRGVAEAIGQCRAQALTLAAFVGWNLAYAFGYIAVGVTAYTWYASPLVITLAILSGFAVAGLQRIGEHLGRSATAGYVLAVVAGLGLLAPLVDDVVDYTRRPPYRTDLYPDVGDWLSRNTPPGSTVGTLEVGIIGYHAHRPIIDFAGLIQPDIADDADPALGFEGLALAAWQSYQPDFVAMLRPGLAPLASDPEFQARCKVAATFERPGLADVMDLFDCRVSRG